MGNRRAACLSRPPGADRVGIGSQDGVTERGERPAKVACLSAWQPPPAWPKKEKAFPECASGVAGLRHAEALATALDLGQRRLTRPPRVTTMGR